jgi:hypothetical protein
MSDDVVFIRHRPEEPLTKLPVTGYEAEKELQRLLEQHPELLAGADMRLSSPRRFVLVRREAPVPDRPDGGARWSIDHLFLDQEAIPTLVEVKRSTDTRIRREVVGQMLDYAANGISHWEDGQLREMFEQTYNATQRLPVLDEVSGSTEPEDVIANLLGDTEDLTYDDYWKQAETNLRAGRIRLVFVADTIPEELRAIIEFLNEKLSEVEVFGVEVRRYAAAGGDECYVPRLVGATTAAVQAKRHGPTLEEKFEAASPDVTEVRTRLEALAPTLGLTLVSAGSLQLRDDYGVLARLNPTRARIVFLFGRLWPADQHGAVEGVFQRLRDLHPGKDLTRTRPSIGCAEALEQWNDFVMLLRDIKRIRSEIQSNV